MRCFPHNDLQHLMLNMEIIKPNLTEIAKSHDNHRKWSQMVLIRMGPFVCYYTHEMVLSLILYASRGAAQLKND